MRSLRQGRGALVESHDDVCAELLLNLDRSLGRQLVERAIEVRSKLRAVVGDGALCRQAEDLKPAAVGEDWPGPTHEAMQSAEPSDDFRAGSKHQVVGVCQDDLRSAPLKIIGPNRLDAAGASYRQEGRRFHHAAASVQPAAPSAG